MRSRCLGLTSERVRARVLGRARAGVRAGLVAGDAEKLWPASVVWLSWVAVSLSQRQSR